MRMLGDGESSLDELQRIKSIIEAIEKSKQLKQGTMVLFNYINPAYYAIAWTVIHAIYGKYHL